MKAIDYIRKGWCQRKDQDGDKVCANMAIHLAYPNNSWEMKERLRDVINNGLIYLWNDAPERTHEEVIAAFEKAGI